MTFLDTNVFIHFLGGEHPLRDRARAQLERLLEQGTRLATSAEVLQELLHYYLLSQRPLELDRAFALVERCVDEIWPVGREDVETARHLASTYPGLDARDLVHLACCVRRQPRDLITFDRGLAAAWRGRRRGGGGEPGR